MDCNIVFCQLQIIFSQNTVEGKIMTADICTKKDIWSKKITIDQIKAAF